jgi:hypothetical protein
MSGEPTGSPEPGAQSAAEWEAGPAQSASATSASPRLRASDAERAATIAVLQDAIARGLLTPDEGSDRMAAVYASRFRNELPAVVADLPPRPASVPTAPGWRALGQQTVLQVRQTVQSVPTRNPRANAALAIALAVLLMLTVVMIGVAAAHGLVDGNHGFDRFDRFDGGGRFNR